LQVWKHPSNLSSGWPGPKCGFPPLSSSSVPDTRTAQPSRLVATRVAIDLALFEYLSADKGVPKTKEQLASKAGADPNLIGTPLIKILSIHTD